MARMGDKLESKAIARAAKVSTIPGYEGVVGNAADAKKIAQKIGYPVMLKASAGGGGKGMRIAWEEGEIEDAFRLASAEAKSSFADDRLLIEKYIEEPRHIEFQIIGDRFGTVLYLPERECSIQRRNQKVLEEAPSTFLDERIRRQMGEQAVKLAAAVGYYSAGTVEFLLDKDKSFYFLEMNTRLQVEHPITELISGIDLVEQMIRVAAGERLPLKQSDIQIGGWAIESRVYAEDSKLFLPSIGTLNRYSEPRGPGIRCDSGIREGSEISVYYDPMICKLSTFGKTRGEARQLMLSALDSYVIRGVTHNIPLLREVVASEAFTTGRYSTKYLQEKYPNGFSGHLLNERERAVLKSVAAFLYRQDTERMMLTNGGTNSKLVVSVDGDEYEQVELADKLKMSSADISLIHHFEAEAERYTVQRTPEQPHRLTFLGTEYDVSVMPLEHHEFLKWLPKDLNPGGVKSDRYEIASPMPGLVISVAVRPGDVVREGGEVAVIEAMKMQNVLKASAAGRVKKVNTEAGKTVGNRQVVVELEPL